MTKEQFESLVLGIVRDLNERVFPVVDQRLSADPDLRGRLSPAFPYPKKVRIAALDSHLVVEYVGPEDASRGDFEVEGSWLPGRTVFDFLGLDFGHLGAPRIPFGTNLENLQVFLGDAMALLGDYLYDVVANPSSVMLNGIPDFTVATEPTYVSNVAFLWSDSAGVFRIRRIDFMELFPISDDGWGYHTLESLGHFAEFIISYPVPSYRPHLHQVLNDFIQLVATPQATEPQITSYLESHPEILQLSLGAHQLNPQTRLIWQLPRSTSDLQPDFMPERMDGFSDILEFKLPRLSRNTMVGAESRRHPSSEVEAALAQVDEYEDWCLQDANREWLLRTKGIQVSSPHTYLVIGHSDDFTAEDRQLLRRRRNATIFTYDEFINMARMQLYRIR